MAIASRRVGRTALSVSELGFGGAPLGNLYNALTSEEANEAVNAAYEAGMRLFDTAPLYGFGLSERRMGLCLGARPRDSFALCTKVGRLLAPADPAEIEDTIFANMPPFKPYFDYSYDGVMRSVEHSLHRLGLHRIDILLIHDVDTVNQGSQEATEQRFKEVMNGGYRALEQLRSEGAVAAIGAGMNEWEWCQRFAEAGDFDCFSLAGRYTLLEQEALEAFLPLCAKKSIGIVIAGPYNSGVLASGPVEGAYYNYAPAPPAILDRVARLKAICESHGVPLAAAALQFPLLHPNVVSVIPGLRNGREAASTLALFDAKIPADLWRELKHEGLVRADAPTTTATAKE
ncbi:MAG: aldo/keto reductase [Hyphomonadaceae bacterium]|nr:aldo/keto reductase [Hyphomonadaceae bacterium]